MPITELSKQITRALAPRKTRDYDEDSMEEGEVSDGDAGTHLASILITAASVAPVAAVAPRARICPSPPSRTRLCSTRAIGPNSRRRTTRSTPSSSSSSSNSHRIFPAAHRCRGRGRIRRYADICELQVGQREVLLDGELMNVYLTGFILTCKDVGVLAKSNPISLCAVAGANLQLIERYWRG
jgi:hypothetical protein